MRKQNFKYYAAGAVSLMTFLVYPALDYNYAKAYVDRGNLYLKTGNIKFAVPDFQKACDLGNQSGCKGLQSVGIGK